MTTGHEQLWRDTSKILQDTFNPELFSRWFAPIKPLEVNQNVLVLGVANEFFQIWLQDNFLPVIREVVNKVSRQPLQVRVVVSQGLKTPPELPEPTSTSHEKRSSGRAELNVTLNPRYTFESFVVGPNSNFAHAAALAVSQSPARAYNPLFVYGGVGLGKTHLMQAIGHATSNGGKSRKVSYISCEQFMNDFIQAIQNSTMIKFRKKYRQIDVLLIDDIQFLGGKERLQDEFFHTFNTLFDAHKQIVLSSDRPAAEIANLENRLVSRFEWGLVTELQPPALETRIAILKKKAALIDVKLSDSVLEFIAEKIRTNIRRLEGALIRVASFVSLTGKEVNRDALESLLRDALREEAKRTITIESIQKKVAEHFDIRIADMTSRRRPQNVAFPRQIAMYLSRTMTKRSLSDIGESFGGRDHGTVLHACRLVEQRTSKDQQLRQAVAYIEQALQRE